MNDPGAAPVRPHPATPAGPDDEAGGGGLASSLTEIVRHLPVVVTAAWGTVVFTVSLLIPLRRSAR